MILEIMQYGDFDIKQTNCLIQVPDETDVSALLKEFYYEFSLETAGEIFESVFVKPEITQNGITKLRDSNDTLRIFVLWLKKRFKVLPTHQITFS